MTLTIDGVVALDLTEIRLTRVLGGPVEWHFSTCLARDSRGGEDVEKLARALSKGPLKAYADGTEAGLSQSGPATIIGASWRKGAVDLLDIRAIGTEVNPDPNPFLPRRRIHRVRTMSELIEKKFDHVCIASTGVLTELGRITFPDEANSSIVQDGLSDWQFLGRIFDQCRLLRPAAPWLPLTLVGGVSSRTSGKWLVTPACKKAYEVWGAMPDCTNRFRDGSGDGFGRIEFDSLSTEFRSPAFPHGTAPAPVYWRQGRTFTDPAWQEFTTQDLPRFTQHEEMIWKIEDRLYHAGQPTLEWESRLWAMPPNSSISPPIASGSLTPWIGLGKVKDRTTKGHWVEVELAGFDPNENIAQARLTSAFSGKGGRKGVHLVPEEGTEVELRWNGMFDCSLLLGGNVRSQDAIFDAPSVLFDDRYTGQFADIRVPNVGQISVESNFGMSVNEATKITSSQPLQLSANGADLKMSGGIVYTG